MNDYSKIREIKKVLTILLIDAGRNGSKDLIDALEAINNIVDK